MAPQAPSRPPLKIDTAKATGAHANRNSLDRNGSGAGYQRAGARCEPFQPGCCQTTGFWGAELPAEAYNDLCDVLRDPFRALRHRIRVSDHRNDQAVVLRVGWHLPRTDFRWT